MKKVEISSFTSRQMAPDDAGLLAFGAYSLDSRTRRLLRDGIPVPLTSKAFDTLEVLVHAAGQTVSKDQLLSAVWPDTFVQEETLAQNVSTIRRALGDSVEAPRYVLTVPREGYRFVAPVERAGGAGAATKPDSVVTATPSHVPHPESARDFVPPAPVTRVAPFTLGVTAGLLLAGLAVFLFMSPRPVVPSIPTTFEVFEPEGSRFSASGGLLALSPDGRHLAFLAVDRERRDQLWIRALGSRASTLLPGTEDAQQPFWSADGRSIAFFSNGGLRRIELSGEGARTICELPTTPLAVAGSWSTQSVILFALIGRGLFQVPASGGAAVPLHVPGMDECSGCLWPSFLPDGRRFVFTVVAPKAKRGIYLGSLDGATPERLVDSVSSALYTAGGYLAYASEGGLMARRFDAQRGRIIGDPVPIAEHVWYNPSTARAVFSASETGVLAYREPMLTRLQWFSRTGARLSSGPVGVFHSFSVAPDGRVVAAQLDQRTGTYDLWLHDEEWRSATRLTFDAASDLLPVWSDDGGKIAFARDGGVAGWQLYELVLGEPGAERPLLSTPSPAMIGPVSWRNGVLIYETIGTGDRLRSWMIDTRPVDRPGSITEGMSRESGGQGQISPDGRWMAYPVNTSASRVPQTALLVRPWPGGQGRMQIAQEGTLPRWRSDGSELFFIAPDGQLMAAPVQAGRGIGPPIQLFPTDAIPSTGLAGPAYDAAPDGQRFLIKVPAHRPSIVVMNGWSVSIGR